MKGRSRCSQGPRGSQSQSRPLALGPGSAQLEAGPQTQRMELRAAPEGLRWDPARMCLPTAILPPPYPVLLVHLPRGWERAMISSSPRWKSSRGLLKWAAGKGHSPVGGLCLQQVRERELDGQGGASGDRVGLLDRKGQECSQMVEEGTLALEPSGQTPGLGSAPHWGGASVELFPSLGLSFLNCEMKGSV